jgi:hypothetical protein
MKPEFYPFDRDVKYASITEHVRKIATKTSVTFFWNTSYMFAHLHLVPRSRIVDLYLHPMYAFMAWYLIKHRDSFTSACTIGVERL